MIRIGLDTDFGIVQIGSERIPIRKFRQGRLIFSEVILIYKYIPANQIIPSWEV